MNANNFFDVTIYKLDIEWQIKCTICLMFEKQQSKGSCIVDCNTHTMDKYNCLKGHQYGLLSIADCFEHVEFDWELETFSLAKTLSDFCTAVSVKIEMGENDFSTSESED